MKVNIISPVRVGGPYSTGKQLTELLIKNGIECTWTHQLYKVVLSPLWQTSDVIHALGIPISYRLWKKPLILTVHGEYTVEKTIWQSMYPKAIMKADVITTPSHYIQQKLNLPNAIIIPNAIFVDRYNATIHSKKNIIKK